MKQEERFSSEQLSKIIDESIVYVCACPAQVAEQIKQLRKLVGYQESCMDQAGANSIVHKSIAEAALRAMHLMENCLDEILELEGWDRTTMTMPEGLRIRRDEALTRR